MGESLTDRQVREMERIAKLEVRQYFDHYLQNVHPAQQKALREHTHLMIERHNTDTAAHGGVERRLSKAMWVVAGAVTAGGAGGAGFVKLLSALGMA